MRQEKKPEYCSSKLFYMCLARLATQTLAWINRAMNTTNTVLSETRAPGHAGPLHTTGKEVAGVSCTVKTFLTCVFLGRYLTCRTALFLTTQSYHYLPRIGASSSTSQTTLHHLFSISAKAADNIRSDRQRYLPACPTSRCMRLIGRNEKLQPKLDPVP